MIEVGTIMPAKKTQKGFQTPEKNKSGIRPTTNTKTKLILQKNSDGIQTERDTYHTTMTLKSHAQSHLNVVAGHVALKKPRQLKQ